MLDHNEQGKANNRDLNNRNDRGFSGLDGPLLELLDLLVEDSHLFHEDNKCESDCSNRKKSFVMCLCPTRIDDRF